MNTFGNETCLNFKHQLFCSSANSSYFLILIDTRHSGRMRDDCCDHCISRQNHTSARSFFINNALSYTSKLLPLNMDRLSCKPLLTIYWTHLKVNGIWARSFCSQKTNNRTLFPRDAVNGNVAFIAYKDATMTSL